MIVLGHEAKEFQEQLAAEVTPVQVTATITLDLLEPIFTCYILNVPLDFQHFFYKFPLSGLRSEYVFHGGCHSPLGTGGGFLLEKVSLYYSLHPLDFLDINF